VHHELPEGKCLLVTNILLNKEELVLRNPPLQETWHKKLITRVADELVDLRVVLRSLVGDILIPLVLGLLVEGVLPDFLVEELLHSGVLIRITRIELELPLGLKHFLLACDQVVHVIGQVEVDAEDVLVQVQVLFSKVAELKKTLETCLELEELGKVLEVNSGEVVITVLEPLFNPALLVLHDFFLRRPLRVARLRVRYRVR